MTIAAVGVQSRCQLCNQGNRYVRKRDGRIVHLTYDWIGARRVEDWRPCGNYDAECRHIGEPMGLFRFAWLPVECRNGKRRWLVSVERHEDGTCTLGDRAQ